MAVGELVMTTLDREAMPLIRYRTRDLTRIIPGFNSVAVPTTGSTVYPGRSAGRPVYCEGCNIFPMQVEGVLLKLPEIGDDYRIHSTNHQTIRMEMTVEVELSRNSFRGDLNFLDRLQKQIVHLIRDEVLIRPIDQAG